MNPAMNPAMGGRAPFQRGPMGGPAPGPWGGQQAAPGPWGQTAQPQRQGMGFLGTAAMTAAGVAGGILAANAISNMFSGGSSAAGAQTAAAPADAAQQPASYEEPGYGSEHAQDASYDGGGDFGDSGGDWA